MKKSWKQILEKYRKSVSRGNRMPEYFYNYSVS